MLCVFCSEYEVSDLRQAFSKTNGQLGKFCELSAFGTDYLLHRDLQRDLLVSLDASFRHLEKQPSILR